MLPRALLLLLVVLNLGIAAWWIGRPATVAQVAAEQPRGVARLQLVSERPGAARTPPAPVPALCLRVGPYPADADLAAARMRLVPASLAVREVVSAGDTATRWRVMLPPRADEDADAQAARLASAGFEDVQAVRDGEEAGSVALGLFASEAAARAHRDGLVAAGFPAQVHADGGETRWLEVAFDAAQAVDLDARALRAQVSALRATPVACNPRAGAGRPASRRP